MGSALEGIVVWHVTDDWHVLRFFFLLLFFVNCRSTVLGYSCVWTSQQSSWPRMGEKRRMEGVEHAQHGLVIRSWLCDIIGGVGAAQ